MRLKISYLLIFLSLLILLIGGSFVYQNFFAPQKPGSCKILDERYCRTVTFIHPSQNASVTFAAYKLPKGAIIFAPLSNKLVSFPSKTTNITYQLNQRIETDISNIDIEHVYTLDYIPHQTDINTILHEGDIIDTITNSTPLDSGGHNLVVRVAWIKNSLDHPAQFPPESKDITQDTLQTK